MSTTNWVLLSGIVLCAVLWLCWPLMFAANARRKSLFPPKALPERVAFAAAIYVCFGKMSYRATLFEVWRSFRGERFRHPLGTWKKATQKLDLAIEEIELYALLSQSVNALLSILSIDQYEKGGGM